MSTDIEIMPEGRQYCRVVGISTAGKRWVEREMDEPLVLHEYKGDLVEHLISRGYKVEVK